MKPVVSVVIPLYNKEKTIKRTLDSVFGQIYQNIEVIVVDDASRDDSIEIARACSHGKHVNIIKQENSGPGAARNRGMAESKGKYITFLDADDEWLPDFLEEGVDLLENNDVACVVFEYLVGEERKRISNKWDKRKIVEGITSPGNLSSVDLDSIVGFMQTSSLLFRKDALDRIGGFYEKDRCTCGEDDFLWSKVLVNYPVYVSRSPKAVYHYESSDLGNDYSIPKVQAALLDPDVLFDRSFLDNHDVVRGFLAVRAAETVIQHAKLFGKDSSWLLDKFCSDRPENYIKARVAYKCAPAFHLCHILWVKMKSLIKRFLISIELYRQ